MSSVVSALQQMGVKDMTESVVFHQFPIAGRVAMLAQNWNAISSDQWVLKCIRGYTIQWLQKPFQSHPSKRDSVSGGGEIKISLEITLMANKQAISEVSIPELGNGCQRPDTKCLDPMHGCGVFRVTKFTLCKNPFKPSPQGRLYFKRRKRKRSPQKLSQYKANMRFPK